MIVIPSTIGVKLSENILLDKDRLRASEIDSAFMSDYDDHWR